MKGKRMIVVLKDQFISKIATVFCFTFLMILLNQQSILAEIYHQKNFLVGDRASLMGGAYAAISDDASGAYYNPAGISFAYGDSVSGSGNAYHKVNTKYKKALGNEYDWDRESTSLLPNYFGLIKKFDDSAFTISYIVPETTIEHQDQVYHNIGSIDKYTLSLHSEDKIYLTGPSFSQKISDSLAVGVTLFYYYRQYRLQQSQYLKRSALSGGTEKLSYLSEKQTDQGFSPRVGVQWSPSEKFVIGVMGSQTMLTSSDYVSDYSVIDEKLGASDGQITTKDDTIRKTPTQLTGGIAYYPNPFWLLSFDLDYYIANDSDFQNVLNISGGGEVFLDNENALRFGFYTNNDKRKPPSDSTVNYEHIDMNGISFGYSTFSRNSSVSIGLIYSKGSGESQPLSGSSAIRDIERESMTIILAATYNY